MFVLAAWMGPWSRAVDLPSKVALICGVLLVAAALTPGGASWLASALGLPLTGGARRRFLTVASFAAAFLSVGYVALYLRGGPRATAASAYWVQGRALSRGLVTWPVPAATASFRARDLVFHSPDRLGGSCAPGFPILLALGFFVGAPMVVGPLVAAGLVGATWLLAYEMARGGAPPTTVTSAKAPAPARSVADVAALMSVLSAGIRYETAEAVPYGAAALALALALACALRAVRTGRAVFFGASGAAIGALVAIQPAAASVVCVVAVALALRSPCRRGGVGSLVLGAAPGVLLLCAWPGVRSVSLALPWMSAAARQSAVSPWGALGHNALDVLNFEPLALLALVPLCHAARRPGLLAAASVVGGQIAMSLALGSTAGWGDLAVVVPVEQALLAMGIVCLFPRAFERAAAGLVGVSLLGFAVHAAPTHAAAATKAPGRPRFEPDVLREAAFDHGLLFFDDDDGYELATVPGTTASHGVVAVRMRGDDNDRWLYDELGHPPARRYVTGEGGASTFAWTPPPLFGGPWRFEAENEWPPLFERGGASRVVEEAASCASGARVLRVEPSPGAEAVVTIALPIPPAGTASSRRRWSIGPRVFEETSGGRASLAVVLAPGSAPLARWAWDEPAGGGTHRPSRAAKGTSPAPASCVDLAQQSIDVADGERLWLELRVRGGAASLDRTSVRPARP